MQPLRVPWRPSQIRLTPKPLAGIRLAVVAKGYDDLLGDMASGAMVLSSRPYDFTSNKHAQAQDAFRDALKSEKYRTKFATLLQASGGGTHARCKNTFFPAGVLQPQATCRPRSA